MDTQTVINVAVSMIIACAGWFAKAIWDAVHRLQEDIHALEITLPTSYVRRDEFVDTLKMLNEKLDRIYDKLENKADRT
jgi:endoglucanase Acf2